MLFAVASLLFRTVLMLGIAAVLALILQGLADPSPLFWAVPWEVVGVVFSRNVRLNHVWFHLTQDLVREASGCLSKLDGFATQDGFVLMGAGFSEAKVRWASELTWRRACRQGTVKEPVTGCKTVRFLLALWLIVAGVASVTFWRGKVDLASAVLLAAVCGAAGHAMARPAEKLIGPWVERVACGYDHLPPQRFEVEFLSSPHFLWFKGGRGFRVRRVEGEEIPSGART